MYLIVSLFTYLLFRDIADEESWIKEKKLLVGSDDYGRDLTGVQNLRKKHKRLESELASHEPTIQVCCSQTLSYFRRTVIRECFLPRHKFDFSSNNCQIIY